MDSNEVVQNKIEFLLLNSYTNFSTISFRHLIKNVKKACIKKGISHFDGLPVEEWYELYDSKAGNEPIFRLIFRVCFALLSEGVLLAEVLVEDPELFIECMDNNSIMEYYKVYPPKNPIV